jgi:hypothetical protein
LNAGVLEHAGVTWKRGTKKKKRRKRKCSVYLIDDEKQIKKKD